MKLLKKEFTLCMHPTGYIMLLMSAFVLIPGYPYTVSCFYMGLAIYFICLTARENHDASYTLTLPVSREDAVRARIAQNAAVSAGSVRIAPRCAVCINFNHLHYSDLLRCSVIIL